MVLKFGSRKIFGGVTNLFASNFQIFVKWQEQDSTLVSILVSVTPSLPYNFNFWHNLSNCKIKERTVTTLALTNVYFSFTFLDMRFDTSVLFSVSSFFKALHFSTNSTSFLPKKFIWKSKTPLEVKAFTWQIWRLVRITCYRRWDITKPLRVNDKMVCHV